MKVLIALAAFWLSVGVAVPASAAPPHTINWTPLGGAPGKQVTLAGQQFVLVRVPVRDLGGARRFSVTFLAPKVGGTLVGALTTLHSKDPLPDPIQIDGFDAVVTVGDSRTYTVITNFLSPGDYTFTVDAHASCTASIKVGQTLLLITGGISVTQQPSTDIGDTPNALPHAEFADYIHPTAQVNGCNKWVDYIRIEEL